MSDVLFRRSARERSWPGCFRRQGGSSLAEIVVATLILGLVAIGISQFFARGRFWFDQEEQKRVASLLAQEALERTVARPYPQVAAWNESRVIASVPYALVVTVETDVPESDMKTVRCAVTWQAASSAARSVSLLTMVYDH